MKKKSLMLAMCMAFATPAISVAKALPSDTVGLNLGEIESNSYLDEPFKGIIPILFTSKEHASQLKARLAPASIFSEIGAEWSPALESLDFAISTINNKPVIIISSKNAIHLPFLNLILEIESPEGSIYQDYTVMLDPRGYQAVQKTTLNNQKITLPKTYSSSVVSKGIQTQYTIRSGDSLSKISYEQRIKGVSLSKMMEGIHLKNPDAFVNNDINKIIKGVVLNLPTTKELGNFDLIVQQNQTSVPELLNQGKSVSVDSATSIDSENIYKVKSGDSLSKITKKFGHEDISFTKMMKAIHTNNPHAFSKNRINLLKVNAILNIPSYNELLGNNSISKNVKKETITTEKVTKKTDIQNLRNTTNRTPTASAKADINLIQQLKSVNTEVVGSLEKRVRELKGELSQVTTSYSDLESTLNKKELLLLKQKHEVKKLKNTITALQEKNADLNTEIYDLDIEADQEETNSISYIPENAGKKIKSLITNQAQSSQSSMSVKDLSYTALALILGLLLIRYRKEIYSYSSISYEHPKFYSDNGNELSTHDEYKEVLDFHDTLLNSDSAANIAPNDTFKDEPSISEENIHECELLVDELLDDLEETPEINTTKGEIISSLSEHGFSSMEIDDNYLSHENVIGVESDNNEIKEEILTELFETPPKINLDLEPKSILLAQNDLLFGYKSFDIKDGNTPEQILKENNTESEININDELMVEILNEFGEKCTHASLNKKPELEMKNNPAKNNDSLFDITPFEQKMDNLINLTKSDNISEESSSIIPNKNDISTIEHEKTSMST